MDLFDAIYRRRDVREFGNDEIPQETLLKILNAAHHAGSVGLMQPWNFTVIRSCETQSAIADIVAEENNKAAVNYTGEERDKYLSLHLEAIHSAPINIAVTCDSQRGGPHVAGRNTMPETDLYSTCCAIQNLWLAARAEGVGMCWVSLIDPERVKQIIGIPADIKLVGYLCLGVPESFDDRPHLERQGWKTRTPLEDILFFESWGHQQMMDSSDTESPSLIKRGVTSP
ncbi:MAG: 5,6-dimethylbenzimidazole synthase [Planctomycetaceae bacterium]|jgi:5,6-dimethylbenzimidazole synthase|nr:5,6-dimethylbenzimidazole synthase [Planctomycetaceae bacterium]